AFSGLTQAGGPGTLDGTAFGTSVNSTIIKSSPTQPASVGCLGNALITKSQVSINVPNVLASGTITDTAQGSVTASLSTSETTSTVQNVNLLNGIIAASVVHADAKASTTDGTTFTFSEGSGSYFTGLVVQGVAYANVAANTKLTITLNGKTLGTLYLHRVIQGTNSITVRMIELIIASGNSLGLPTGMDIIVASASASLHSPAHP
ncbi:MAG TPA: choice-of-anchor P family protein, partial [Candidatus Udaeobacter sp.]